MAINEEQAVETMVNRLRELQAAGESDLFQRRINTDNGITGGGTLEEDRTLGLSAAVRTSLLKADASVSQQSMDETLASYVQRETLDHTLRSYVLSRENTKAYTLPFSHPGTITSGVDAPPIPAVVGGSIARVGIGAAANPSPVDVVVNGNRYRLSSNTRTVLHTAEIPLQEGQEISLRVESQNATGVTVALRVVEG